ncbi:MAG: hypothetical protein RDU59_11105 [Thermodesulfobacteriota bacterium]|nr:hypothetical protein [Desulfovibrionales bacterium]MDQ7839022.1 hypothetical protein [Thermodesulfobacteriota bacterium]
MNKQEIVRILLLSPLYLQMPVKERMRLVMEMVRRYAPPER